MSQHPDSFFVGYLPVSASLRRRLVAIAGGASAGLVAATILFATAQSNPGSATASNVSMPPDNSPVIAVGEGKRGLADVKAKDLTGAGIEYRRGNLILFEPATPQSVDAGSALPIFAAARDVELTGEIIDPKCYAGAMKPGDGATHKSCAALCILGGVPPMLLVRENGSERLLRLVSDTGQPYAGDDLKHIASLVGVEVTVRGQLSASEQDEVLAARPRDFSLK